MLLPLHANPSLDGRLVAFRISNGALAQKELPTRMKLLDWGTNQTIKGPVIVDAETVRQLSVNQAKNGYDRVAIDFNHQTVPGSEEYEKLIKHRGSIDPLPVAGYGTPVVIPGDGLYLENIEWTPAGREAALNYHDLSPTPLLNKKGEVVFLHSVALCRQGAVDGLSFFNASLLNLKPMATDNTTPNSAVDFRSLLVSILQKLGVSIPDGASDSDIASMVDQYKAPEAPKGGDKKKGEDEDGGDAPPTTMTAGEQFLFKQIQALRGDREVDAKNALVVRASQEGKVIPLGADEIKATPLAVLQVLVDKLPATVPTVPAQRGNGGGEQPVTLSAEEKAVIKNLGISEEAYLKDKKANPLPADRRATI